MTVPFYRSKGYILFYLILRSRQVFLQRQVEETDLPRAALGHQPVAEILQTAARLPRPCQRPCRGYVWRPPGRQSLQR